VSRTEYNTSKEVVMDTGERDKIQCFDMSRFIVSTNNSSYTLEGHGTLSTNLIIYIACIINNRRNSDIVFLH